MGPVHASSAPVLTGDGTGTAKSFPVLVLDILFGAFNATISANDLGLPNDSATSTVGKGEWTIGETGSAIEIDATESLILFKLSLEPCVTLADGV